MAISPLPPLNTIRQLLRYDPETGQLFWLERSLESVSPKKLNAYDVLQRVNTRFAGKVAGSLSANRIGISICGKIYQAHRLAWVLHYGKEPEGVIDHINGDPKDNRIVNLRDVSTMINCRNQAIKKTNTSGHNGVSWSKSDQKWRADARGENGKKMFLGNFKNIEAAIAARREFDRQNGYHQNHGITADERRRTLAAGIS